MPTTRYEEGDGSVDRARQLRRDATPAERRLGPMLRAGALNGYKFRRQQRLGPFFGDFVCQSARLVIELDGESHDGLATQERDARRTSYLEREGYRVVRFSNADVMANIGGVVEAVRLALAPSPSHPATPRGPLPLPHGERRS